MNKVRLSSIYLQESITTTMLYVFLELLRRRSKAFREKNENLIITICTELANQYVKTENYHAAITEYAVVADIHKKHNKLLEYGLMNRGIGEAYLGLRNFNKGLEYLKVYLSKYFCSVHLVINTMVLTAIARDFKNKIEEQRALATIGHIYLASYLDGQKGADELNLCQAEKFFIKSLNVCQRYFSTYNS